MKVHSYIHKLNLSLLFLFTFASIGIYMFIAQSSYAQEASTRKGGAVKLLAPQWVPVSFSDQSTSVKVLARVCGVLGTGCNEDNPDPVVAMTFPWIAESSAAITLGSMSAEVRAKAEPGRIEFFGSTQGAVGLFEMTEAVATCGWGVFFKPNSNQVLISWDLQVSSSGDFLLEVIPSLVDPDGNILLLKQFINSPKGEELVCVDPSKGSYMVDFIVAGAGDSSFSLTGTLDVHELNDPNCPPIEICTNGMDDDGDGLVDCNDPDCPPCSTEDCTNGIDDDGDGLVDCNDPDCPPCPIVFEICNDGVDNDGDGQTDCNDPDCVGDLACVCQCFDDSTPPTGCISGRVTSKKTGASLAGKTVNLKRTSPKRPRVKKTVTTDGNGCYDFADLEDGTYEVKVKKCKGGGKQTVSVTGGGKVDGVDFQCR